MTPQHHLFFSLREARQDLPLSFRSAARALKVSHPVFQRYIIHNVIPHARPDFAEEFTAFCIEQRRAPSLHPNVSQPEHAEEDRSMLSQQSLPDEALKHWGLTRDPFYLEMTDPEDVVDLKELNKAQRKVLLAIERQGWVAITGEVGSGKTTLLRRLSAQLAHRKDVRLIIPEMFEKQLMKASHICTAILEDLGIHEPGARGSIERAARIIGRAFRSLSQEGNKVAIVIDEAHLLEETALKALKRIYEVKDGYKNTIGIVLIGQPGLARKLRGTISLSEVTQRVDLFELESLNGSTGLYLRHKLQRAGASASEIFSAPALKLMTERAKTPLELNNLAAACLTAAWEMDEKQVSADVVKSVYGGR